MSTPDSADSNKAAQTDSPDEGASQPAAQSKESDSKSTPPDEPAPTEQAPAAEAEAPAASSIVAQPPATANPQSSAAAPDGRAKRRSRWQAAMEAHVRLQQLSSMPRSKFRESDRTTATLLTISIVLFCALLVIPLPMAVPLILIGDVFLFATLVCFLANRFGIISHLADRDVVLVSDLMTGMLLLGVLFAGNIGCMLLILTNYFK